MSPRFAEPVLEGLPVSEWFGMVEFVLCHPRVLPKGELEREEKREQGRGRGREGEGKGEGREGEGGKGGEGERGQGLQINLRVHEGFMTRRHLMMRQEKGAKAS